MITIDIRKNSVPANVILLSDSSTVPDTYSNYTCYNTKHLRIVPNSCTNPGTCTGNASHTHCSAGCHTHSPCNPTSHTHPYSVGGANGTAGPVGNNGAPMAAAGHTHSGSLTGGTVCFSIPTSGSHTHDTVCNAPLSRTYRMIQKTSVVNMRKKHIPFTASIMWGKNLCTMSTDFTLDTNGFNRLIKIDTCAGTNAGSTGHQHSAAGHTHSCVGMSAHSHTIGPMSTSGGGLANPAPAAPYAANHTHPTSGGSVSPQSATSSSDCDSHTHDCLSLFPATRTVGVYKHSIICQRKPGIPFNALVLWACNNTCIPSGLALADGTSCTDDFTARHLLQIPNACTNPGVNANSDTHTHSSIIHCHAEITTPHSHTMSGTTPTFGVSSRNTNTPNNTLLVSPHNHSYQPSGTSSAAPIDLPSACTGHTHGSKDHQPPGKQISLIQKL